jgi:chromosome partitioning protein
MAINGKNNNQRKVVVLNPKGGSGKTTVASNLAAFFAWQGSSTALMDCDPQGSSLHWLSNRSEDLPRISGIAANKLNLQATRSWQLSAPPGTDHVVVDTPAAIRAHRLIEFTRGADAILIPVGPSDTDIHAATVFISDLLLVAKEDRRAGRLGVVANRVRERTVAYRKLMRFLDSLVIPLVGVLRDSQNYLHAAAEGKGIHEFKPYRVRKDLDQWEPLVRWLETRAVGIAPIERPPVQVERSMGYIGRPTATPVPSPVPGPVARMTTAPLRTVQPNDVVESDSAGNGTTAILRSTGS